MICFNSSLLKSVEIKTSWAVLPFLAIALNPFMVLTDNLIINLDYIYVIFGKDKAYNEYNNSLYEKMKKSFKRMQSLKVWN